MVLPVSNELPYEEAKTEEELPATNWEATKKGSHEQLDDTLRRKEGTFEWPLRKGDSANVWEYWSSTFEVSLLKSCGTEQSEAKP